MVLIRIDPTKILVGGDKKAAATFIGPAKSQLNILKNQMSFQKLSQGIRRVWLNENVYVECKKIFNYQECKIWVRPIIEEGEKEVNELYFYVRIVCTDGGDPEKKEYSYDLFYQEPQILGKHRDISLPRTVDRLILWKCRKESKGKSPFDSTSYEDVGMYEDGSYWAITTKGSVIMDVDVVSRTVYSSNNGIDVDTSMSAEAQLALADRYIEQINTKESLVHLQRNNYELHPDYRSLDPDDERTTEIEKLEDITSFFYMRGEVINPLHMATECDVFAFPANPEGYEVYFDEPLSIDIDDTLWNYYHYMEPPRTYIEEHDIYRWYNGQCNNPPALFESLEWPGIETNKEKYLPTKRDNGTWVTGNAGQNPLYDSNWTTSCPGVSYGADTEGNPYYYNSMRAVPFNDEVTVDSINNVYTWKKPSCDHLSEQSNIKHLKGSYYTSRNTYPCFFVTLVGQIDTRRAGFKIGTFSDGIWMSYTKAVRWETRVEPGTEPGWSDEVDSSWPKDYLQMGALSSMPNTSANSNLDSGWIDIEAGETGISTPLEQYISMAEFLVPAQTGDSLPTWVRHLQLLTGGALGELVVVGMGMHQQFANTYPTLTSVMNDILLPCYDAGWTLERRATTIGSSDADVGSEPVTRLDITVPLKTTHFADSFTMVRNKTTRHLSAALAVFYETNYTLSASRNQINSYQILADGGSDAASVNALYDEDYNYKESFDIGILFYLIYPAFDIKVTGDVTDYWDIHAEREYSQDETNHNREVDLEEYVSGVLRDIKDSLPYADSGIPELLIKANYDITNGFICAIH